MRPEKELKSDLKVPGLRVTVPVTGSLIINEGECIIQVVKLKGNSVNFAISGDKAKYRVKHAKDPYESMALLEGIKE